MTLKSDASIANAGYYSGDSHIHLRRQDDTDDQTIFDLLQAEDIHFASILAYNEPAGPYEGVMQTMGAPQFRGLGTESLRDRGDYHFVSGQEYRSPTYGHLNLYFRNDLVLANKHVNANNGPLYGVVARETRDKGGFAFYCHGGYAQSDPYAEIYADAIQGNIDGVELLQFGIYRELGLEDWYRFQHRLPVPVHRCQRLPRLPLARRLPHVRESRRHTRHEGLVSSCGEVAVS